MASVSASPKPTSRAPLTPRRSRHHRRNTIEAAITPRGVRVLDITVDSSPSPPPNVREQHSLRAAQKDFFDTPTQRYSPSKRRSTSVSSITHPISPTSEDKRYLSKGEGHHLASNLSSSTSKSSFFSQMAAFPLLSETEPVNVRQHRPNRVKKNSKACNSFAHAVIHVETTPRLQDPPSPYRGRVKVKTVNHRRTRALASQLPSGLPGCDENGQDENARDAQHLALAYCSQDRIDLDSNLVRMIPPLPHAAATELDGSGPDGNHHLAPGMGRILSSSKNPVTPKRTLISLIDERLSQPTNRQPLLSHQQSRQESTLLSAASLQLDALGIISPRSIPMVRSASPAPDFGLRSGQQKDSAHLHSPFVCSPPLGARLPTIVVTPPFTVLRNRITHTVPPSSLTFGSPNSSTLMQGSSPSFLEQDGSSLHKSSLPDGLTDLAGDRGHPSHKVQELRSFEDQKGLDRLKLVVDAFLSEFFVERTEAHAESMNVRLVHLLRSAMDPDGSCEFRSYGRPTQIPSLCGLCTVGERSDETETLQPAWVRCKLESTLDIVLEHIITGMIALIVDDRAPYSTPRYMALLSATMQAGLTSPYEIHFNAQRKTISKTGNKARESHPFGHWMHACASAVGLSTSTREQVATPLDLASLADSLENADEADAWRTCLIGLDPSSRFVDLLSQSISMTLERGKAARERNTLLVVTPSRRGSRKRWQAAHEQAQAQKAWHDELFRKMTRGQITESEYRSEERRRAAMGNVRDTFAALNLVRFVGELFNESIVDVSTIADWIRRLLLDTVFPGVPSTYELEAGCALLITVGHSLDKMADEEEEEKESAPDKASLLGSPFVEEREKDKEKETLTRPQIAQRTMTTAISRLSEIEQIQEIGHDGRSWCREVVALHVRGWRQAPSTEQLNAVSSAAVAARKARRGDGRIKAVRLQSKRAHEERTFDPLIEVPPSWLETDEDETMDSLK